ncbi:hypothetical protein [Streptomyces sp. A0592]|uniref:hypothetical protein n=1 Tax=Streptomyces sp. A0592 TaxID=2563099 RepID=UPI00109E96FA|nr:hypothetical protein [Streptomyces sp. A0592]THA75473.1 hypothetical protein E6U81_36635 [Streptomyces sp. A0592]
MITSVRHRTQQDLTHCVRAWVAELHPSVARRIALSHSGPDDAAPALWSARTGVAVRCYAAP